MIVVFQPAVYCTCLLTDHSLGGNLDLDCNPMFYVNVNDIESLQSTRHYVACELTFSFTLDLTNTTELLYFAA